MMFLFKKKHISHSLNYEFVMKISILQFFPPVSLCLYILFRDISFTLFLNDLVELRH